MDKIQELNIPIIKQKIFNNWRLCFQVTSASEIYNHSRIQIQKQFITKKLVKNYVSTSNGNWPIQEMPCISTFNIWSTILKSTCTYNNIEYSMQQYLGPWIVNPSSYQKYNYLIHQSLSHVLTTIQAKWWVLQRSHTACSKTFFIKKSMVSISGISEPNLSDYFPVDVEESNLFYYITDKYLQQVMKPIEISVEYDNTNTSLKT
jgi:hypothetical protein